MTNKMQRYRVFFIDVKNAKHIPDAVCTVLNFELLMMGEETARNMEIIDSNKEYSIALHLVSHTWKNITLICVIYGKL
jgi:hypothetical protein